PLPIVFVPGRGGSCLYIPMVGWAVIVSGIFLAIARLVGHEPSFRRVPLLAIRAALATLAVVFIWKLDAREAAYATPLADSGRLTASVMQQLKALQPSVKPHTQIAFVNNPFSGGWDLEFIADLTYNDHTLKVLVPASNASPEKIAASDLIFSWDGKRLVRLKP